MKSELLKKCITNSALLLICAIIFILVLRFALGIEPLWSGRNTLYAVLIAIAGFVAPIVQERKNK